MYFLFSLLTGVLIALMIAANGALSDNIGTYTSTVIIHLAGLVFMILLYVFYVFRKKNAGTKKKLPVYLYLGGILGVGTIVFNNIAFGKISVSAMLALGLLGQSAAAILIDQFGWFGMHKTAFRKRKIIGLAFVIIGIFIMITLKETKQVAAITVALLTGLTVILSRTVNARLAEETNIMKSTLVNYITGTVAAIIVLFAIGRGEMNFSNIVLPTNIWMYTGGIMGVFAIMLLNITVTKISSFYLTLMLFIGQVFAGIIVDMLLTNSFSVTNLIGGILVAVGLSLNVWFDNSADKKNKNIAAKEDSSAISEKI